MHLSANQPFRLECGWLNAQAFRWTERDDWLYGIVGGALIKVRNADGGIEFEGDAPEEAVRSYFRLNEDITAIHAALRKADPKHMPGLIKDYGHIRVLRQDPWECLVAYICSANASVDSIRGKLNKLANCCGDTRTLNGVTCRSVPSAKRLADAGEVCIEKLKLGLRHLPGTLHKVATDVTTGDLDLRALAESGVSLAEARARLKNDDKGKGKRYRGIGPKIADCVCLFSLGKDDAFPIDTNIGAAVKKYYGKKYTPGAENVGLLEWAHATFGKNAGYAGQLLFLDQRSPLS